MLQLVTLPPPEGVSSIDPDYLALLRRVLAITVRTCTRTPGRGWVVELVSGHCCKCELAIESMGTENHSKKLISRSLLVLHFSQHILENKAIGVLFTCSMKCSQKIMFLRL